MADGKFRDRIYNFSAGPAVMPLPVLEQIRDEMLNYRGSGMSVMEMSHRGKVFAGIHANAIAGIRRVFGVPDDYAVLFLQGGASLQFSMVPMNLYLKGHPIDMLHTGEWTKKAIAEIKKLADMNMTATSEPFKFSRLPRGGEITLDPRASYVHICTNNTIYGTQWQTIPETGNVPLVADMSSDIFSRPVDVHRYGLIFAGAQKNIGPSGLTLVIIRKDLAERADANLPTMLQYRTHIKEDSLYNTPPAFGIYIVGLVMQWMEREGGLAAIAERNERKARLLYDAIDSTEFYNGTVDPHDRSRMNVNFRILGNHEELEGKFIKEAAARGLDGLKGHRSVGGLRASIYNAHPEAGVKALVEFMKEFEASNG